MTPHFTRNSRKESVSTRNYAQRSEYPSEYKDDVHNDNCSGGIKGLLATLGIIFGLLLLTSLILGIVYLSKSLKASSSDGGDDNKPSGQIE